MLVCFMHTEQNYHFPAVCFWKNLISDAVKYWFSLTSVKALIFLLGLDIKTFQTRFFLAFWASIKFLLMISHFPHIAMSLSVPSSCPQPMAVASVFPNHLSLEFHYGYKRCNDDDRGNWHANFSFDYIHYLWKELKIKLSPEPVGRIAKTSWPWRTRFKQIFWSSQKDLTYRKCLIVLFIVAFMSTWFDNRCPSPSILHSSSMSPVLEC